MCGDPEKPWYPQRHICYADMERAAVQRKYDALHEDRPWHDGSYLRWSKERTTAFPYHAMDGVTLSVALEDHAPDDDFLSSPQTALDVTE